MVPLTCLSKKRVFHLEMKRYFIQNTEPRDFLASFFTRSKDFSNEICIPTCLKQTLPQVNRLYNFLF